MRRWYWRNYRPSWGVKLWRGAPGEGELAFYVGHHSFGLAWGDE